MSDVADQVATAQEMIRAEFPLQGTDISLVEQVTIVLATLRAEQEKARLNFERLRDAAMMRCSSSHGTLTSRERWTAHRYPCPVCGQTTELVCFI